MESWHTEGTGGDYHSVGVEIEKSNTEGHHQAMYEIQKLKMSGPSNYEKSKFRIINPDDGYYRLIFTNSDGSFEWETDNMIANGDRNYVEIYTRWWFNRHGK